MLQLIVEEVSGMPFDQYAKQTILDPLGMKSSTFGCVTTQAYVGVAQHYKK